MSSVQPWPYCGMPPAFSFSAASAPSSASCRAAALALSAFASSANTSVPATVVSWMRSPSSDFSPDSHGCDLLEHLRAQRRRRRSASTDRASSIQASAGNVADRRRGRVARRQQPRDLERRRARSVSHRRAQRRRLAGLRARECERQIVMRRRRGQQARGRRAEPGGARSAQRPDQRIIRLGAGDVAAKLDDQIRRLIGHPAPDVPAFRLLGILVEAFGRRKMERLRARAAVGIGHRQRRHAPSGRGCASARRV